MKKIFLLSIHVLLFFAGRAQQVPIGSWRSHLPYSNAFAVADGGTKIYCATHDGLFSYEKDGGAIERISTINGMAEVSISALGFNEGTKTLVIAYSNGNIDLLDSRGIINLPFIK